MASRTTIALLIDYLGGDYQSGLLEGVRRLAEERDVNLLTVVGRSLSPPNAADAAQNRIYERLSSACVDGVIVGAGCLGLYAGADRFAAFCRSFAGLPVVSVGATLPGIPSFVISNRSGMRTVVDHLVEFHGCRRVACVRGPQESEEAEQRFEGYVDSLSAHGLEFIPELVEVGNFWINSGAAAAEKLVQRGLSFDAVVAGNDYMALGALDTLQALGRRIPHDVLVAGFDDAPSSRTGFRSLTTVRQPLERLGRSALEAVLKLLAGGSVAERVEHDVELVTRQSCGCAYRLRANPVSDMPLGQERTALSELEQRHAQLRDLLEASTRLEPGALGGWANRLLLAFRAELRGDDGRFLLELEDILDEAQAREVLIDEFNTAIGLLRSHFRRAVPGGDRRLELDDIWHAAVLLIGAASNRSQVRLRTNSERAQDELRQGVERLSTAFDHETLKAVLVDVLRSVRVPSACLSLYEDKEQRYLRCLFAYADEQEQRLGAEPFPAERLVPAGFWRNDRRWSYSLFPITFAGEQLGLVVLELGAASSVYMMLREQIGAALKGAALHRAVVYETTRRERAERERLNSEAVIARRIQTGLLPETVRVEGLEWAGAMVPAYEVGGDYYDVIPTQQGCWIGMGDVTGHGLTSGLLMMMIQSLVAGMVSRSPRATPAELVIELNALVYSNVRARLGLDDHASLVLLRYERDGKLTFAGFHEEILIWRESRRACERIDTKGVWVGARPDISGMTEDFTATLEEGDLLVLYSDGAVEAMNSSNEQFGVERLCEVIESLSEEPVGAICETVMERVRHWSPAQLDDISLWVARRRAAAPAG